MRVSNKIFSNYFLSNIILSFIGACISCVVKVTTYFDIQFCNIPCGKLRIMNSGFSHESREFVSSRFRKLGSWIWFASPRDLQFIDFFFSSLELFVPLETFFPEKTRNFGKLFIFPSNVLEWNHLNIAIKSLENGIKLGYCITSSLHHSFASSYIFLPPSNLNSFSHNESISEQKLYTEKKWWW